ncbi:RND transporter [Desulfonema ishimotonii]|uniref:RND transporter n=1 Tax=Desulfonema ishimotonii TaxID=45657 RepID=A0A401FRS3_9BACT|nr:MMPL family transporter [Desulfonema ishimotonii]GBC59672.1 RND transporter [Desulfonema ishimotonii]
MKTFRETVIHFSVNHYKRVTLLIVVMTLMTGAFFPMVTMDTDPENMLEKDEPARVFHNKSKKRFDLSDTVVLGVINENDPDGVFNPATLKRIHELTEFAKTLRWQDAKHPDQSAGVIEVDMIAPSLVDHMSQDGPGVIRFEWLMSRPPETRKEALAIRDKALSNPLLKGQMVSEDGRAICMYLPLTDKLLSYRVYTALNEKIEALGGDEEYHITGLPVAEGAIGVEMFTQMGTAAPLAMAVIFGLLLLFFRKWVLIILPMIIATVSIICTMGLMIGFGFPVHILSSMLPIFLMSISMVDSVHVLSEFFDVYTKEKGRRQSIEEVMNTLFAPMLYTSLTTAAGFLSLTLAPIPPARVFGGFLSIGVMVAWLLTILFVPAYIMMIPERMLKNFGLSARQEEKENRMTRALQVLGRLTCHYAKPLLGVLAVLILVAIWGITQIRINDNYAKRFAKSHPLRKADIALNSHFGGTYTAYLVLEGKAPGKATEKDVRRIYKDLIRFADQVGSPYEKDRKKDQVQTRFQESNLFEGFLIRVKNPAGNEHERAPELARQIGRKLSYFARESDTFEGFLDSAIEYIEKISTNAPDEEYYAWQELQRFFGIEKERLKTFKRPEVLGYMAGLQAHMEQAGLIGKSISVADVVRKVNQELMDGKPENFRIPYKLQGVAECYLQYQQSHRPNDLWHLVSPDYRHANIRMQFTSGDSMNTKAAVRAVEAYFRNHAPPTELTYRWAGLHYINLVLEGKLVWGFLNAFVGSFLVVFIMMSFLFRSPLWGLLCMVPLSVTLVVIYGITGIIGKDYDLPIAVLSALSIGMAVDFAIHFLERSRAAYREKGSWRSVVPVMFGEPARAISRNVLVIAIGFLPLLVAPLVPYKTTGVMLFAILAVSGLITLLALPAVLTVAEKRFFRQVGDSGFETVRDGNGTAEPLGNNSGRGKQMLRRTASLTLFLSGIPVIATSIILYIGPPTHVAHFSDWTMLGLTKCQWNAVHIMVGLLFLIAMLFHIGFNWKPILVYLKNRRREMVLFTRPFVVSLVITAYVCVGTLWGLPPMSRIIQWVRSVKIAHVRTYGTPPYGQAERSSLESIAMYMCWDVEKSIAALRKKGIRVDSPGQSIKAISRNNRISTSAVLETMKNENEG